MRKKPLIIIFLIFTLSIFVFYFIKDKSIQNKGILSLAFDDGYLTQYTLAYPEMQKYSFNGTLYLIVNLTEFESKELMTFEQAEEMQEHGWEIGSHGLNHKSLTILSKEKVEKELSLSKDILENKGFKIYTFAFPFGYYNEEILNKTKKYYFASRPMVWGYNDRNNTDFYTLKSKWVKKGNSPQEICSWVEYAHKNNLWLTLVFHYIGNSEERPFDESINDFKEILNCVNETNIKVKTIKEVLEDEKRI